MVQDGLDKDQVDPTTDPKLKPYEWLLKTTSKVYQTPFIGGVKKPKAKKGRRLRGTINQANYASRKLRQKVDA